VYSTGARTKEYIDPVDAIQADHVNELIEQAIE
jgi:hypothetical protein